MDEFLCLQPTLQSEPIKRLNRECDRIACGKQVGHVSHLPGHYRIVVLFISSLAGRARSPTYRNGAQLGLDNNLLDLSIRQERFDLRFVLDVDYVTT